MINAISLRNLKPIKTTEQAKRLGRKGGRARTQARKVAQKLRGLKKTNPAIAHLMQLAGTTNPTETLEFIMKRVGLQMQRIARLPNESKRFYAEDKLMEKMLRLHQLKFGEKHQNLNINIDAETIRKKILEATEP